MKITQQRAALIEDLQAGAKIMVTYSIEQKPIYEIIGGGKRHSDSVVEGFFPLARDEGLLVEVDGGLFKGCGQCFSMVR
jgi:hypothetical protein